MHYPQTRLYGFRTGTIAIIAAAIAVKGLATSIQPLRPNDLQDSRKRTKLSAKGKSPYGPQKSR